jgi:hypothetical protein
VDLAVRERLGRFLPVYLHSHHRVGVCELAARHEKRESAEVVCLGDDDALGAPAAR